MITKLNRNIAIKIDPDKINDTLKILEEYTYVTWVHCRGDKYDDKKPTSFTPNYRVSFLYFNVENYGDNALSMMTWCSNNTKRVLDKCDVYTLDDFLETFFGVQIDGDKFIGSEFEVEDLI